MFRFQRQLLQLIATQQHDAVDCADPATAAVADFL